MDATSLAVTVTLCILALAGLFGLIESLYARRKWRRREQAERTRTTGVVVGFAEERHRHGKIKNRNVHYITVYRPIVRFQVDDVEYRLKSDGIVPRDEFPVGQTVDLLYDSSNPTHFHLDRGNLEERSTKGTIIFALIWLICAVIALLICARP